MDSKTTKGKVIWLLRHRDCGYPRPSFLSFLNFIRLEEYASSKKFLYLNFLQSVCPLLCLQGYSRHQYRGCFLYLFQNNSSFTFFASDIEHRTVHAWFGVGRVLVPKRKEKSKLISATYTRERTTGSWYQLHETAIKIQHGLTTVWTQCYYVPRAAAMQFTGELLIATITGITGF